MLFLLIALFVASLNAGAEFYTGSGVELNVGMMYLGPEWDICMNITYGSSGAQFGYNNEGVDLDILKSQCTTSDVIMACRAKNYQFGGEEAFEVLSTLTQTEFQQETVNEDSFLTDNGFYHYDKNNARIGISLTEPDAYDFATSTQCDEGTGSRKICWETDGTGVFKARDFSRCGTQAGKLNSYQRFLYYQPCGGVNVTAGDPCQTNNKCKLGPTFTCNGAGVCVGSGGTKTCLPSTNPCKIALGCDPQTGTCIEVNRPDGTECIQDQNNLCTQGSTCDAGVCQPGIAVVCPAGNATACTGQGVCNPLTGNCSTPSAPDNTLCGDVQNACQADRCNNSICVIGLPKPCFSINPCFDPGDCNPQTGTCSAGSPALGNNCTIGNNLCSLGGTCNGAGECIPDGEIQCETNVCTPTNVCNPATGECNPTYIDEGDPCLAPGDENACTTVDVCDGTGICRGTTPVICTSAGICNEPGICNTLTGLCTDPFSPFGKVCGTSLCNAPDTCDGAGSCDSGSPVVCPSIGPCFNAGSCNVLTGCQYTQVADGTPCSILFNPCVLTAECDAGLCLPTSLDESGACEPIPDSASTLFSIFE